MSVCVCVCNKKYDSIFIVDVVSRTNFCHRNITFYFFLLKVYGYWITFDKQNIQDLYSANEEVV